MLFVTIVRELFWIFEVERGAGKVLKEKEASSVFAWQPPPKTQGDSSIKEMQMQRKQDRKNPTVVSDQSLD